MIFKPLELSLSARGEMKQRLAHGLALGDSFERLPELFKRIFRMNMDAQSPAFGPIQEPGHIVALRFRLSCREFAPVDAADIAAPQQDQIEGRAGISPEAKPITSRRPFQASERSAASVSAPPTGS